MPFLLEFEGFRNHSIHRFQTETILCLQTQTALDISSHWTRTGSRPEQVSGPSQRQTTTGQFTFYWLCQEKKNPREFALPVTVASLGGCYCSTVSGNKSLCCSFTGVNHFGRRYIRKTKSGGKRTTFQMKPWTWGYIRLTARLLPACQLVLSAWTLVHLLQHSNTRHHLKNFFLVGR